MRIFVSGATGVIGRRVIPLLVTAGHQVSAVGRTPEQHAALEQQGATPVQLDLFAADAVHRAVAEHQVVINLATHIPPSTRMGLPGAWRENDHIRRAASAILLAAAIAAGAERFIQVSFAPLEPDCGDRWSDARTPFRAARYNRTLVDAARAADRFSQRGRVGVVVRFAPFSGPDSAQTRELITFVRRGWAPIPGAAARYFCAVAHDAAATAVIAALGVPAGVSNVVEDEPLRRREVFGSRAAARGVAPPKLPPAWLTPRFGSLGETLARSFRSANRKLRDASGWTPQYPSVRAGWHAVVVALREAA